MMLGMTEPTDGHEKVNPAVWAWIGATSIALSALMTWAYGQTTGEVAFFFLLGAFLIGVWMWKGL